MISAKKLDQILNEMSEISGRQFLLFSAGGEQIAGGSRQEGLARQVSLFADSLDETMAAGQWIFFRVELHGVTEYVLLCSADAESDPSFVIEKMALCQIRNLFLSTEETEDRVNGLRQILTGEITGERAAARCRQLRLTPGDYALFVIRHEGEADAIFVETLKNLFANNPADFVIEMDDSRAVLIKETADLNDISLEQYAKTIVDNLQSEAMTDVWVGYGSTISSFEQMGAAYQDACTALKVGSIFHAEEKVYYYQKLGIGRLIYKLPADLCEMFLREVLGDNMEIDLDEQTMTTIKQFFENNLNISETARQLYVHRNTLIYRLDRIEEKLGLDIRSFEDAMLLRIAMMVRLHLNELKL